MGLIVSVGYAQVSEQPVKPSQANGALSGVRHRAVISTDIGGTDPDDFQSMVHLLVYADLIDLEGLISSPYGPGRKSHLLEVIDAYERDYPALKSWSEKYPTPDALRAITKQGETEVAPYAGVRGSTEGSRWIIECARRDDPRPLHVLVWGGIEDLAQSLHDAPDILEKLRVYFIGGPNKKWSPDAYQYLLTHHPTLWIIEANSTYCGWFTGGVQSGEWSNFEYVTQHIANHGALGSLFQQKLPIVKMGDTPSVGWLLNGTAHDPSQPGWGGQFVRAWERPYKKFDRVTASEDQIELFGIAEFALPMGTQIPSRPEAYLIVENQSLIGFAHDDGTMRFRFSPKIAKEFKYTIKSNVPALNGQTGSLTAVAPPESVASQPAVQLPNWWTDDPARAQAVEEHLGAKSVSQWRVDFLKDFADRMDRCAGPKSN